jgi:type II secretion system protein I
MKWGVDLVGKKETVFLHRHDTCGFTLLEVMVTVAILAIALVAILKANFQSLEALAESREATTATLLAANKLEEVEAVGVDRWTEFQGDFGEEHTDLSWRVESDQTTVPGLVRVVVTVQRQDGGMGRAVTLEEWFLAK